MQISVEERAVLCFFDHAKFWTLPFANMGDLRIILFAITLTVCLFAVQGDVNVTDISGKYRAVRCERKMSDILELFPDGLELAGADMLFDGTTLCEGVLKLKVIKPTTVAQKTKYGVILRDTTTSMSCGSSYKFIQIFEVLRPKVDTDLKVYDNILFSRDVTLEAGRKYVRIRNEYGGCLYVEMVEPKKKPSTGESPSVADSARENTQTSDSSPPTKAPIPNSTNTENKKEPEENSTVLLWTWLGPLLGAISTIIAALIGVYCVKQRNKEANDVV